MICPFYINLNLTTYPLGCYIDPVFGYYFKINVQKMLFLSKKTAFL